MSDQTPDTQDDQPSRPAFVRVFENLRRRPSRSEHFTVRNLEHTVARRRPARRGKRQRGDIAEPPPVLDLVTDRREDRPAVLRALVRASALGPVWLLPEGIPEKERQEAGEVPARKTGEAHRPPARRTTGWSRRWPWPGDTDAPPPGAEPVREPREGTSSGDADGDVTTQELYELLERLVDGGFAWRDDQPAAPRGRKPPPPPRFSQVRSLLWLRRCNFQVIRGKFSEGTGVSEHGTLLNTSSTQVEVIRALRETRLDSALKRRDELLERAERAAEDPGAVTAPSRWELLRSRCTVYWRGLARGAAGFSRFVNAASRVITFGAADEKILTPLSFVFSLVLAATPFGVAYLGLLAQQADELVSLLVGTLLVTVYMLTVFFFLLPWRPYLWLNRHRYVMDLDGRGPEQGASPGGRGRHRAHGVHLLNQLNNLAMDRARINGPIRPPGTHQIAVNALLDDLHREYGAGSYRLRRGSGARPVLVYDQRRLDRVGRYFVWLIEQERLRRAFPDPLLLVQVRDAGLGPLVEGTVDSTRNEAMPEFIEGGEENEEEEEKRALEPVRSWTRRRYLAGVLGVERVITRHIAPLPEGGGELTRRGTPEWVLSGPVLAGLWTGGVAGATAVLVLFGMVFLPSLAQASNPCVQDGVWQPKGITRKGDQCVGVTDGAFVFNERLTEVTELVHEQNKEVEASGQPYVTIAHLAEFDVVDPDDPSLSGSQGELLGLAYQQGQHNRIKDSRYPRIKLLIANAGRNWEHSLVAAKEIVDRAEDERLGMDRPIAAVGFGHSVVPNSNAIKEVGDASITMVGTTATFDDVAQSGAREHSEFYFPVSPANTRIAEQSAHWARYGVSWRDADGAERGLRPHQTAVAIASGETDAEGGPHEQYGPHLAREFIAAFKDRGGRVWEGAEGLERDEYDGQGVLLYQNGESETDTTYEQQLERLCTDEDPPDLLYYAGRSDDFTEFYRRFTRTGGEDCVDGRMTILGGDDVSKFVSDEEELIGNNAAYHSVFYTPLAPSGPWGGPGGRPGGGDQGFYRDMATLQEELFREDGQEERSAPKTEFPSIAHAAVASDALLVVSEALPTTGLTQEQLAEKSPLRWVGLDRPPFLRTQEQYEEQRDDLHSGIKGIRNLTGVSGYIEFDAGNDGNWYDGRMVQLVLVGPEVVNPETGHEQRQHVVQRCGMRNANTIEPGEECLPLGPGIGGRPA
ncbi:ABC transporter substrate-binding protein [Nocardiopsis prasina]|uniref:ABC transporter substrate-binding protein n=1 Tax=Nocardiopsis prasina TaxID=2015 RepID=UPI00034BA632|nr:ABC transporter substrate-binding protein [Nocardiopsis prasina]